MSAITKENTMDAVRKIHIKECPFCDDTGKAKGELCPDCLANVVSNTDGDPRMTNGSMRVKAETLLSDAHLLMNKNDGSLITRRVLLLEEFLTTYCKDQEVLDRVTIETNKNYNECPKPKAARFYDRIGGVGGKYQIWAVIR